MDLLGIENDPALLLGVDGRNPARRDKFFGQSSADDAIKVNQPDHRAGILRVGAPESSGQAEEVKTARACALRGEVAPRRDVLFRARKRTCPNQSGLERSTLRQEIFASVFARRNRDRLIEARPTTHKRKTIVTQSTALYSDLVLTVNPATSKNSTLIMFPDLVSAGRNCGRFVAAQKTGAHPAATAAKSMSKL